MAELSDELHNEIKRLCGEGDQCAAAKQFPNALQLYWSAWDLLPEPKTEWNAATWILAAIGDSNFLGGDYVAGRDNLSQAMHCPAAIGNPFLHMRLGQCQLELRDYDRAADELMRAYAVAGRDIFEDQDPKYLGFLKTKAQDIEPPKRSWQFWK